MENIVLEKIPQAFSEGLMALFEEAYSYRKNMISSFLRSTDLVHELNNEEGDQIFSHIIGAAPVTNFEMQSKTDAISYSILKKYYSQKPIEKSQSRESYNKANNKNRLAKKLASYSSYYTMLGIAHIEEDRIGDFIDYLEIFNAKEKREELTTGLKNLFDELGKKAGFDITPVFLGVGIDLDCVYK